MKVNLKKLDHYSPNQIQSAEQQCPAIGRYFVSLTQTQNRYLKLKLTSWLQCALATLFKTHSTAEIVKFWSLTADQILRMAWKESKLSETSTVLVGMGKLGAEELNLSSDVDLILIAPQSEHEEILKRLRIFQKILTSQDSHFILRLDFDLRPGGRFSPIVSTLEQTQNYYWTRGETWERLAWIRARHICGPQDLYDRLIEFMNPFVHRRFLDFSVLEDLRLLRRRIQNTVQSHSDWINIKLAQGGIRDIELFTQSLSLIHGGRRPLLKTSSTSQLIQNLSSQKLLESKDGELLEEAYWIFRHQENLYQAVEDSQTHEVRATPELKNLMNQVNDIVSSLLSSQSLTTYIPSDEAEQQKWLQNKGLSKLTRNEVWPELMAQISLSGRTEKDEVLRREFLLRYLDVIEQQSLDGDLAIENLLKFIKAVKVKHSFLTLLNREPRITADLARLFSVSPYLGEMISARPQLLDSFLTQMRGDYRRDWNDFLEDLLEERQINEWLSVASFLERLDTNTLNLNLSSCADQIAQSLLLRLNDELEGQVNILALGKWGSQELGIKSDLDFIFVTAETPTIQDFKVARKWIHSITNLQSGGRIYDVDLRLRPSGSSGPLLTSELQLLEYLTQKTQAWERQAYLRARWLNPAKTSEGHQVRHFQSHRTLNSEDLRVLFDIRQKFHSEHASYSDWELKTTRGGLSEIEFTSQILALQYKIYDSNGATSKLLISLQKVPQLNSHCLSELNSIYLSLRQIEQLWQICSHSSSLIILPESDDFKRVARVCKMSSEEFFDYYLQLIRQSRALLSNLDPLNSYA